jgi:hypothetical protein
VLPDVQRRGTGTQLINKCVEELRKNFDAHSLLSLVITNIAHVLVLKGRLYMGLNANGKAYQMKHSLFCGLTNQGQVSGIAKYREEFNEGV